MTIQYIFLSIFIILMSFTSTIFWCYLIGSPHLESVKKGRLLWKIGAWLDYKYTLFEMREDSRVAKLIQEAKTEEEKRKASLKRKLNFWKIFGLCPACTQPYITVVVFGLSHLAFWVQPVWWSIIPILIISNYCLRVSLVKYEL